MVKVIASGSTGNAVLYFNKILVDCGVHFKQVQPYLKNIQIILLTHEHSDHINVETLAKIQFERPGIRIGCGSHLKDKVSRLRNVDIYEPGLIYQYLDFQIIPVILYHDVKNFGYRIFDNSGLKAFHATDTAHLEGIIAKYYDFYCLEQNFDDETIFDKIIEKESRGEFAYQRGAINSHLSEQKAKDFFYKNAKESSLLIRLHESKH